MYTLLLDKPTQLPAGDVFAISGVSFLLIFAVLAFLIGVIYLLRAVMGGISKKSDKKSSEPTSTASPAPAPATLVATATSKIGSCGGIDLYNVDPKDAAMVMAILADELKTPLNQLKFISIKRIDEVK